MSWKFLFLVLILAYFLCSNPFPLFRRHFLRGWRRFMEPRGHPREETPIDPKRRFWINSSWSWAESQVVGALDFRLQPVRESLLTPEIFVESRKIRVRWKSSHVLLSVLPGPKPEEKQYEAAYVAYSWENGLNLKIFPRSENSENPFLVKPNLNTLVYC